MNKKTIHHRIGAALGVLLLLATMGMSITPTAHAQSSSTRTTAASTKKKASYQPARKPLKRSTALAVKK